VPTEVTGAATHLGQQSVSLRSTRFIATQRAPPPAGSTPVAAVQTAIANARRRATIGRSIRATRGYDKRGAPRIGQTALGRRQATESRYCRAVTSLSPVAPRERVLTVDVLRGFALLGVLIANLFWLYSARQFEHRAEPGTVNQVASALESLLVQGKAQSLLTFLFGFGFAVQLLRAQARNEPVIGIYLRRLLVLSAIGSLHVMLWWGDVTWHYGLTGFALLLFLRASNRTRLLWAAFLIFVPSMVVWGIPMVREHLFDRQAFEQHVKPFLAALHGKSFWPTVPAHVRFALAYLAPSISSYFPWLVGQFLLGYVAGTQRWFDDDGAHHLRLFRRMLGYGLVCALGNAAVAIRIHFGREGAHQLGVAANLAISALSQLGVLGLTAAYVSTVVLLMQRERWRHLLSLIAPVGRMPLTTYISQSLICTFLFYGWGLGWAGHVWAARCIGLALLVFTIQIVACHVWLRRFRFGPLEWVWRTLVYMRRQPMRVQT
jgi:uncharacterized protein